MASHDPARNPRDFRIETNDSAARVCDLRQPCSGRKEQSVQLGAEYGGGGGAVLYVKLEGQQQQQQYATYSLAGGNSDRGFNCW